MNAKERARNIVEYFSKHCLDVKYLAAQIEEAERQAVEASNLYAYDKVKFLACWKEGFRAAQEKAIEIAMQGGEGLYIAERIRGMKNG